MDLSSLDLDAVTVHQQRRLAPDVSIPLDWAQETDVVKFFLPLVGALHGLSARDLNLKFRAERLEISRRGTGGQLLVAGTLGGRCDPSECEWQVLGSELVISLRKSAQREWLHSLLLDEALPGPTGGVVAPSSSAPALAAAAAPATAPASAPMPPPAAPTKRAPAQMPQRLVPGKADAAAAERKGALADKYHQWDRFDDMSALAQVENAGLDPDAPTMTLRSSPGKDGSPNVAGLQCTEYVKDQEEIALDEELGQKRTDLQRSFNQTARRAMELKEHGNKLLGQRRTAEALEAYLEGEQSLELITGHAAILLSAQLRELTGTLRRDLQNNGAQAALTLREWDEAIRLSSEVLALETAQPKALYRRAAARVGRAAPGDTELARADLRALLRVQPHNSAAQKLLDGLGHLV